MAATGEVLVFLQLRSARGWPGAPVFRLLIGLAAAVSMACGTTALAQVGCDELAPLDAVPAAQICAGFSFDGAPYVAHNAEELQVVVNGGYTTYTDRGFIEAVFQNYTVDLGSPVGAMLSLFNQGETANAVDLYGELDVPGTVPIADWTGSGLARSFVTGFATEVQFQELCFYGSVLIMSGEDEALASARCLGEAICDLIYTTPSATCPWGKAKTVFH